MAFPPIIPLYAHVLMDGTEQNLITCASDNIQHFQVKVTYNELADNTEIVKIRLYDTRLENYDTSPVEVLAEIDQVDGTAQTTPATIKKQVRYYISSKAIRVTAEQTGGPTGQRNIYVEVHKI